MGYFIKNHKNVFIKLSENGRPMTCAEHDKDAFEYVKAKNILKHLPRTLKRLNFAIEEQPEEDHIIQSSIQKKDYVVSENVVKWIEKFGSCADILNEAKKRQEYLVAELDKADKELLDILHIVELGTPKDLYGGWKDYKRIQDNRERRRIVKDELLIIGNVLRDIDVSCMERERIQKAIDGLFGRKYSFRIMDEK